MSTAHMICLAGEAFTALAVLVGLALAWEWAAHRVIDAVLQWMNWE